MNPRAHWILLFCLAVLPGPVSVASDNGTVSGMFLRLPPSAAAAGMGEAGVAMAGGSNAIFINPGGLAAIKGGYAAFSHTAWADTLGFNSVSAAFNTSYGVAALGLRELTYGRVEALDNTGAASGSILPRDMAVEAGWAVEPARGFAAGLSVRYIESRIVRVASTYAVDGGVIKRVRNMAVGVSLQNIGGALKFNKYPFPLPANLKMGAGVQFSPEILGVLDLNITRGSEPWLAVGGKYTSMLLEDMALILRAGYNTYSNDAGGISGFAAGIGFSTRVMAFDYSARAMGEFGPAHHVSISTKW